jgi:hypothetical protein
MAMRTVGDLIRVLNYYKENYPEFEKYNLCIDVADDDSYEHDFRDIELYINTDIGQVEIGAKTEDE